MWTLLVTLTFILFSATAQTGTKISLFYDVELAIPDYCYFIVRGTENDFDCPIAKGSNQSISFREPDTVKLHFEKLLSDKETINNDSGQGHVSVVSLSNEKIEEFEHYLEIVKMFGIDRHSYTICDSRSCISFYSSEVNFISALVSQISTSSLYDQ